MSQRAAIGCIVVALAATWAISGCAGPDARGVDPLLGGPRVPIAQTNPTKADPDADPLLLPSASTGRSPAALTNDGESNKKPPDDLPPSQPAKVEPPSKDVVTAAATADVDSFEKLQEKLQALGVRWQQLKTCGNKGKWLFSCGVPDPNNSGIEQNYEVEEYGAYGIAAIKAVIAKIEEDKRQGTR